MIKAAFFDIDGTLVSFKTHQVPDSTIEALNKLRAKGIKTFVATGRHKAVINNLGDLPFDGYITLNGGMCLVDNRPIYKHSIPREDVNNFIRYQERNPFPTIVFTEKEIYINYSNRNVESVLKILNFPHLPQKDVVKFQDTEVMQFVSFFQAEQEKQILQELPRCEVARWHPLFADIIPRGSSKQVGIDKIAEYFGIGIDECIAFGDGGNDISMLRDAGIGVAMGNATDEVKQNADYVTAPIDDDGILYALRQLNIL